MLHRTNITKYCTVMITQLSAVPGRRGVNGAVTILVANKYFQNLCLLAFSVSNGRYRRKKMIFTEEEIAKTRQ